jgi:hypothetical protein
MSELPFFSKRHDHLVAVGREARRKRHVGKIAQHLLAAAFDVEQIDARLAADIRHVGDHLRRGIEARRQHHVIAAGQEDRIGAVLVHDRQALLALERRAAFGNEHDAGVEIALLAGDALIDRVGDHVGDAPPVFGRRVKYCRPSIWLSP